MIRAYVRDGAPFDPARLLGLVAAAGIAVVFGAERLASRGLGGLKEIAVAVAAPLLLWTAWARPLIFPYGLYLILAPLDVLMQLSRQDGTVARLLGLVSAVALIFYAVRTKSLRVPPRAIVWLLLFCGWIVLSTLWSIGTNPGKEATTMLEISGLYVAVACFPTRRRDLVPLLATLVVSGLVAALIGIYEFRFAGAMQQQTISDYHRITVSLGQSQLDPNMYADSLLVPFAIALAWFARAKRMLPTVAALGVMAILVSAIALAGSRDATIGLAIETLVLTSMLGVWKRVALPVGALIGGTLALFPNVFLRALADNGGGYGRTSIWHVAFAAFLQHPFVGAGSGSFAAVYDRWYLRVFEPYDVGWNMASHDIIIHYGVELGAVGLLLVFGWGISQWLLARSLPRTGLYGDLRAICVASLAALAFAAFFIDLFDVKFVWLLFGLIAQTRAAALGERAC